MNSTAIDLAPFWKDCGTHMYFQVSQVENRNGSIGHIYHPTNDIDVSVFEMSLPFEPSHAHMHTIENDYRNRKFDGWFSLEETLDAFNAQPIVPEQVGVWSNAFQISNYSYVQQISSIPKALDPALDGVGILGTLRYIAESAFVDSAKTWCSAYDPYGSLHPWSKEHQAIVWWFQSRSIGLAIVPSGSRLFWLDLPVLPLDYLENTPASLTKKTIKIVKSRQEIDAFFVELVSTVIPTFPECDTTTQDSRAVTIWALGLLASPSHRSRIASELEAHGYALAFVPLRGQTLGYFAD